MKPSKKELVRAASLVDLPIVRGGERATYKRCEKKWYWAWRRGLVPRQKSFGPLELGGWWHEALAVWYGKGHNRVGELPEHFVAIAEASLELAQRNKAPEHVLEKAEELIALGEAMAVGYVAKYGDDPGIFVIATEVHLEFTIPDPETGVILARHRLTPDLVFLDDHGVVWLMEHKTAKSIQTEHLRIDDQARPYSAMARRALINAGIIKSDMRFGGMLYNYSRKALPDLRRQNEQGKYLNQNGSVSKKQPPPYFERKPIVLSRQAKVITLERVQDEILEITAKTLKIRNKDLHPARIRKTPHHSCPRYCEFFDMCVAEEQGAEVKSLERSMFRVENPYETAPNSDVVSTFEMS